MTNPTDLLPRFAAASEWLAEHHPDAPRLPGWIAIDNEGFPRFVSGKLEREWVEETLDRLENREVDNPAACLCGAVVWAMEVAMWSPCETEKRPPNPDAIENRAYDTVWCVEYLDGSMIRTTDHFTEAALMCLESICESLGREG